jgi:hypothetical protein
MAEAGRARGRAPDRRWGEITAQLRDETEIRRRHEGHREASVLQPLSKEKMMQLKNFRRVSGTVKALSAVTGAGVFVTMRAMTVACSGHEVDTSTASPDNWAVATIIATPPSAGPETAFAEPTHKAIPCPPRATFPCS